MRMSLQSEGNTDLAYDTETLRKCGSRYAEIARELRIMSQKLDICLAELVLSGWTRPAGTAFHKMANTNWSNNIEKYADLLDTLNDILVQAAGEYDNLTVNHIEKTVL